VLGKEFPVISETEKNNYYSDLKPYGWSVLTHKNLIYTYVRTTLFLYECTRMLILFLPSARLSFKWFPSLWLLILIILILLYSFFWVFPRYPNFMRRRFGTLCVHLYRWCKLQSPTKMEQSVPKRRDIKFGRREITQKKEYNIQKSRIRLVLFSHLHVCVSNGSLLFKFFY
jgi:hypothetical protein